MICGVVAVPVGRALVLRESCVRGSLDRSFARGAGSMVISRLVLNCGSSCSCGAPRRLCDGLKFRSWEESQQLGLKDANHQNNGHCCSDVSFVGLQC